MGFADIWVRLKFRAQTRLVLFVRSSSYQDIIIYVYYYSKSNRARKLAGVFQKYVLRVHVLFNNVVLWKGKVRGQQ